MFVEVVRLHLDQLANNSTGWLAGLRDPLVGRALTLLHARPAYAWSLEELAAQVAASRSTIADRFSNLVGYPPIQYLTQWRMQIAAKRLADPGVKIAAIAHEIGYESEAAFSEHSKKLSVALRASGDQDFPSNDIQNVRSGSVISGSRPPERHVRSTAKQASGGLPDCKGAPAIHLFDFLAGPNSHRKRSTSLWSRLATCTNLESYGNPKRASVLVKVTNSVERCTDVTLGCCVGVSDNRRSYSQTTHADLPKALSIFNLDRCFMIVDRDMF